MKQTIYPGSFDPITNGHLDIIERASKTFESVIVAISSNIQKKPVFTVKERIELVKKCVQHCPNVTVDSFSGLLMDFAKEKKVRTILRGLRANSDFEYEFQLATLNRKLRSEVETVLMMTGEASFYISSRLVKEIAQFGGDVSCMTPPAVEKALRAKFKQ